MSKILLTSYIFRPLMNLAHKEASIRQAFGDTMVELGSLIPNLYVVSVDLKESLRLDKFANKFKNRFIECGVAENNAAGVAAGLAASGKTVFLASYACFSPGLNWATIRQSICYNHHPVKIIGGYAGLMTGVLGASHQMLEDIAITRALPGMEVFAPVDAVEMTKMLPIIAHSRSPSYIRMVAPATPVVYPQKAGFTIGKSIILSPGKDITVLSYGPILAEVVLKTQLPKKVSLEVINCSSLKPLDTETILKSITKTGQLIVIEDHQKNGGLGEAVASLILKNNLKCKFVHLGVDDQFGQSAIDYHELYAHYHLSQNDFIAAINTLL